VVAVVTHAGPAATVTLAVAGHPLPLLRLADGAVMPVGSPGMLVGVAPDADVSETRLWLRPGDALVCYTDGVTERRRSDTFFGLDGLIGALGATSGDASALAAAVERSVLDFAADPPGDDLAILVLRTKPGGPTRL
jgi:serine phosphatase RsbU (regulator of sigma subunit)